MKEESKNALLLGYLEKISWRVLDQYPKVIKQLIRHKSGVYALYRQDKLYYVGLAKNLMGRVRGHLKDRHKGSWDRFSVYLTIDASHMKQLESLLLRIARPDGNRVSGGFGGPKSLYRTLNKLMSHADADRRAGLIGGFIAKHRRAKAAVAGGSLGLAGLVERRISLRARFKGRTLKATLRRDGYVSYHGQQFASPSAAAKQAVGHATNGWRFWQYRVARGQWEPLSNIRGTRTR
jgi:hypothetical protein